MKEAPRALWRVLSGWKIWALVSAGGVWVLVLVLGTEYAATLSETNPGAGRSLARAVLVVFVIGTLAYGLFLTIYLHRILQRRFS